MQISILQTALLLSYCTDFFDPFGRAIGLDGVIIMAFLLGFPANETVIPIIIMSYLSTGTLTDFASYEELFALLTQNGWTLTTAICTIVMCIFHFPCSTTCLTIKKETGSMGWTMFSYSYATIDWRSSLLSDFSYYVNQLNLKNPNRKPALTLCKGRL